MYKKENQSISIHLYSFNTEQLWGSLGTLCTHFASPAHRITMFNDVFLV